MSIVAKMLRCQQLLALRTQALIKMTSQQNLFENYRECSNLMYVKIFVMSEKFCKVICVIMLRQLVSIVRLIIHFFLSVSNCPHSCFAICYKAKKVKRKHFKKDIGYFAVRQQLQLMKKRSGYSYVILSRKYSHCRDCIKNKPKEKLL